MTLQQPITSLSRERTYLFPITSAIILTFMLFFVDEGYYDLRWMKSGYNWLIFSCFVGGFFVGQAIISTFFLKRTTGIGKKTLVMVLGLPLGVIFIIIFMYSVAFIKAGCTFLYSIL